MSEQSFDHAKILSFAPPSRRTFLAGVNAGELFDLLEVRYTDTGGEDGTAYRRLYADALKQSMESDGPEPAAFLELLESLDVWALVETNVRRASFLVGFETCRQLLLGELVPPPEIPAAPSRYGGAA